MSEPMYGAELPPPGELWSDEETTENTSLKRLDSYEDLFYGEHMFLSSLSLKNTGGPVFSFDPSPSSVVVMMATTSSDSVDTSKDASPEPDTSSSSDDDQNDNYLDTDSDSDSDSSFDYDSIDKTYWTEDDHRRNEAAREMDRLSRLLTKQANRRWKQAYTESCDICQEDVYKLSHVEHKSPKVNCPNKFSKVKFNDTTSEFFFEVSADEENFLAELKVIVDDFAQANPNRSEEFDHIYEREVDNAEENSNNNAEEADNNAQNTDNNDDGAEDNGDGADNTDDTNNN